MRSGQFIIVRFAPPDVTDMVYVEGLAGDLYIGTPSEVETYSNAFRTLTELAASADETRETCAAMIPRYGG